jgi:putative ABC transport system permease protein
MGMRFGLAARLALADMRHDAGLFTSVALTVTAVLAPLLVLLGLKTGVVEHLVGALRADPATREIVLRGHMPLPPEWFATMRARPDVAFVAPRMRQLAQPVDVGLASNPIRGTNADFVVSAAGDPVLARAAAGVGEGSVVLSQRLAQLGGFKLGDEITVWAIRRATSGNQRIDAKAKVAGIAPATATQNAVVFGPLAMAAALEAFQERDSGQTEAPAHVFPSFRLYARDITDVAGLERDLLAQSMEVRTEVGRIGWTLSIDRNLTALFAVLTGCGAAGVAVTLAVSLWGNVARKRRALSLLRLLGLPAQALVVFPLVQGGLVALAGSVLAAGVALGVGAMINAAYGVAYLEGSELCIIAPVHILVTVIGSVVLALLASLAAVRPVLRIAPSEGMREA